MDDSHHAKVAFVTRLRQPCRPALASARPLDIRDLENSSGPPDT